MKNSHTLFVLCVMLGLLWSCDGDVVKMPKPRMYPRIFFPQKNYQPLELDFCAFDFVFPTYGKIVKDTFKHGDAPQDICWFDIKMDSLNADLHCSYHRISQQKEVSALINDAFYSADKHNIKANYRKETVIENTIDIKGILFDIEGPVASPVQFYITDEKKHFFRASLYFNSKVNPDSTDAVLKFIRPDIEKLIATFKWK